MSEIPTREVVVSSWKLISDQGFEDPADISEMITGKPKTPEMLETEKLFKAWYEDSNSKAVTDEDKIRARVDATMIYIDAGFRSRDYLDDAANDWLAQDADNAQAQGFTELAAEINSKIDEINKRLGEG